MSPPGSPGRGLHVAGRGRLARSEVHTPGSAMTCLLLTRLAALTGRHGRGGHRVPAPPPGADATARPSRFLFVSLKTTPSILALQLPLASVTVCFCRLEVLSEGLVACSPRGAVRSYSEGPSPDPTCQLSGDTVPHAQGAGAKEVAESFLPRGSPAHQLPRFWLSLAPVPSVAPAHSPGGRASQRSARLCSWAPRVAALQAQHLVVAHRPGRERWRVPQHGAPHRPSRERAGRGQTPAPLLALPNTASEFTPFPQKVRHTLWRASSFLSGAPVTSS